MFEARYLNLELQLDEVDAILAETKPAGKGRMGQLPEDGGLADASPPGQERKGLGTPVRQLDTGTEKAQTRSPIRKMPSASKAATPAPA